jgi:hypothetical protein
MLANLFPTGGSTPGSRLRSFEGSGAQCLIKRGDVGVQDGSGPRLLLPVSLPGEVNDRPPTVSAEQDDIVGGVRATHHGGADAVQRVARGELALKLIQQCRSLPRDLRRTSAEVTPRLEERLAARRRWAGHRRAASSVTARVGAPWKTFGGTAP